VSVLGTIAQRFALVAAWGVVVVVFGILEPDTFLTTTNFSTILGSQAVVCLLALALLLPLTAGDYDLSVASNLVIAALLVAYLNVNHGWSVGWAILAAVGATFAVGVLNGLLVTQLSLDPFIVTLGTGTVLQGIALWISGGLTISGVSSALIDPVVTHRLFGIQLAFYYALALCVILWYVFEYTPVGRRLLIAGRGRKVARLSGLNVRRLRLMAFAGSGLLSGVAGIVYVATTGAADPTSGNTLLLPAYAAAFLGATTIIPGRFNPWGTVIAVYFLATGITGLQLIGVEAYVQQLFYGGALVIAVALSHFAGRGQSENGT
jgi:ribose transport system permease protein